MNTAALFADRRRYPAMLGLILMLAAGAAAQPAGKPHAFCAAWPQQASAYFLDFFPGENGWIYKTIDFSPLHLPEDRDVDALAQLVAALAVRGTHLVLVVPPPRGLVAGATLGAKGADYVTVDAVAQRLSYRATIATLARSGALVPDIMAAVEAVHLPPDSTFYRKQDIHWSAEGAQLTANAVAGAIAQTIDLSAFPPRHFVTRRTDNKPYSSKLAKVLNQICGIKLAPEVEPRYITEATDAGITTDSAGGNLLGETSQPVVLAGTSFSNSTASNNFSGFLNQALAQDVLNVAIPGGGLKASMLSYLGSVDFRDSPPAVLIWEVRPMELPDAPLLTQLLTTLEGECDPQSALFTRQVSLERGLTPLLTLSVEERQRMAGPSYLDLDIGDTAINKFTLRLSYNDFSREDIDVDLTRAPVATNHYYFPLPTERLGALETIALRPAVRTPGEVTVSVCTAKLAADGKG